MSYIAKKLSRNYRIRQAQNGNEGWILTLSSFPDLVISDVIMPEMDGFKILENMQASEKLHDIPIIVISGMELSAEQRDQLNEFGQRLLLKGSFSEKELLTSLQRSLERVHT